MGLRALGQQRIEIELAREHREFARGTAGPFLARAIAIKLDAVLVRIMQVERLAHTMVSRAIEPDSRAIQPAQCITQRGSIRIAKRHVKKPGRALSRRRTALALPRIQTDVMMISARTDECGLRAEALHQLEAEHAAIELERAIKISHLQVNMADVNARVDRRGFGHPLR